MTQPKKYVIGILIGLAVGAVGVAYAKVNSPLSVVDYLDLPQFTQHDLMKVYDSNNQVVCYIFNDTSGESGISCLK